MHLPRRGAFDGSRAAPHAANPAPGPFHNPPTAERPCPKRHRLSCHRLRANRSGSLTSPPDPPPADANLSLPFLPLAPEKPANRNFEAISNCEGFVIADKSPLCFHSRNCSAVKEDPLPCQPRRQVLLRYHRLRSLPRFADAFADDVALAGGVGHSVCRNRTLDALKSDPYKLCDYCTTENQIPGNLKVRSCP